MKYSRPAAAKAACALLLLLAGRAPAQTKEITLLQQRLTRTADSVEYVDVLNRIGMLMHLKNPDSCLFYGMKSRHIAARRTYAKGMADADNVIGIAMALKGFNKEALGIFSKVLSSYRAMGDTAGEAQVYMNFASTSMQLGREADAIRYSRLALRRGSAIPNDSIMGKVYANYCIANPKLSRDSVAFYLHRSDAIARRYRDGQLLLSNRQVLALSYMAEGCRDAALPLLEAAYEDARRAGLERLQIIGLNLLAEYHAADSPELALSLSETQYELAVSTGYEESRAEILMGMMRYAALAGNSARENQIARMLVGALLDRQQRLGTFIGDYVRFGRLQEDYEGLEASERYSRRASLVLAGVSLVGVALFLLLLRAHVVTRRESRKKTLLNALVEEQNGRLRRADEFKARLVSILAHDFRSPLLSTLSLLRLLESENELEAAQKESFYSMLQGEISGLLGQFDLTLQWIRQQLRGEAASSELLDMRRLFEECAEAFSILLAAKEVALANTVPEGAAVSSNREMVQFVNRNLISNALKFSPAGGGVVAGAVRQGSFLLVWVADAGPGIAPARMEDLFTISDAGGSTARGAGIALSMSRDFIESLGGRIWAEANDGGGTRFCYTLPL